jgi:hypothetical protein
VCCNRALVDRVSENHNWRILLADASTSNSVAVLLHLEDAKSAERIYAVQELAEGRPAEPRAVVTQKRRMPD